MKYYAFETSSVAGIVDMMNSFFEDEKLHDAIEDGDAKIISVSHSTCFVPDSEDGPFISYSCIIVYEDNRG